MLKKSLGMNDEIHIFDLLFKCFHREFQQDSLPVSENVVGCTD